MVHGMTGNRARLTPTPTPTPTPTYSTISGKSSNGRTWNAGVGDLSHPGKY